MAGVSTPALAAAVSNAGGLGSISVGASDPPTAQKMILDLQSLTERAINVNVFVHRKPEVDPITETEWLRGLAPLFEQYGASEPNTLRTIYKSFDDDDEMVEILLSTRPKVVSFHFGVPRQDKVAALKAAGCLLIASATNSTEALAIEAAGLDAVIAQGFEAGGHRGVFDPSAEDSCLGTLTLTESLVAEVSIPVIAAGGIMDGKGIASVLALGADGAQLGTAFIACPESAANAGYREALTGEGERHTEMTTAISGRPARCLSNRFTAWANENRHLTPPDYPRTYHAGKALDAAAKQQGEFGFGAQWAGQSAHLSRALPAADLVKLLASELEAARHL